MNRTPSWSEITRLEPSLASIEDRLGDGRLNMTQLMVQQLLVPMVGQLATHPRLRTSDVYRSVYRHLAAVRATPEAA